MVFIYPVIFFTAAILCYLYLPKKPRKSRLKCIAFFSMTGLASLALAIQGFFVTVNFINSVPVLILALIITGIINDKIEELDNNDNKQDKKQG
jgi:4-amino-4-deoxy-L-arabinose transferase-like glycosyltransferase